jgi:hypothetical protein
VASGARLRPPQGRGSSTSDHQEASELKDIGVALAEAGLPRCQQESEVSRAEFALAMLVRMGKIEREDVGQCVGVFDRLDIDGSGTLGSDDVLAWKRANMLAQDAFSK